MDQTSDRTVQRNTNWLEMIAAHSTDAIIVIDKSGIIRFANAAAEHLAERSGSATLPIVGNSYEGILKMSRIYDERGTIPDPRTMPTYLAFKEGIETYGKVFEQVFRGVHYWLSVTCIPVINAQGETNEAIVYFTDITNSKSRDDRLKFLVESSKILSITTDFNTRLTEKAKLMVPALADWCTVNVVNIDGTLTRIAIIHRDPEKAALVEELARQSEAVRDTSVGIYSVLATGRSLFAPVVSEEFLRQNGTEERLDLARKLAVCSSMIIPIKSSGKVIGVLSLAYAESERHYTLGDLQFMEEFCLHLGVLVDNANLYAEIRNRDKSKDAFLTALSHELRNPLAPIKSSLEIMILTCADETQLSELRIIEHQFNHLAKLLDDLLDVRRYALGKIRLKRERVVLQDHIRNIVNAHSPFIQSRRITFNLSLPSEGIFMWADQTRLEQAIGNILHNAEKFTPENGSISITVSSNLQNAIITITDSGSGMEPQELANIFSFNEHRKPHEKSGLGMGLVLVREITRLHGGTVVATSEGRGRGSSFTFTFPLDEPLEGSGDVDMMITMPK